MKRWAEEPGAPWLAEVRKLQSALRELEGPFPDLSGLLSPGDEVLGLLADSPEALPLVAFSPFAALPESPASAPAGRTEGTVERAGRAPEPPRPSAGKPRPPGVVAEPDAPSARRAPGAAAEPERERSQGSSTPPPVFSLRSPQASGPVLRTEPRAVLPGEEAPERRRSPHPLTPSPEGRGGNASQEAEAVGGGLKLLSRLADDVLRERDAPPGTGFPVPPVLRLRETVPPGKKKPGKAAPFPSPDRSERLPEIPAPAQTSVRDVEPVNLGTLARRGAPALPAAEEESSVKATFGGATVAAPKRPAEIPAAESSFESPFEAEALADLVNEVLIEQARRHGVDLS